MSADQPISLTSTVRAPEQVRGRPVLSLGLLVAAIGASAGLTRGAPHVIAADVAAKVVAALAACWLAATIEQTILGSLRGRGAFLRGTAALLIGIAGFIVATAGGVAALHVAPALGERGTLALVLLVFGVWLCGAAFGSLLAGTPDSPRRGLRSSMVRALLLVFLVSALVGVALAHYGPALMSQLRVRLPGVFAPLAPFRPALRWVPVPWLGALLVLLLFALAAALSAAGKLMGAAVEGLAALRRAFDDAARGVMRTRVAAVGPREVLAVTESHLRMRDALANRRDLERLFAPKSAAALELLQKFVPEARLAPSERVATVLFAELRDLGSNLRATSGEQMVWLFGQFFDRVAEAVDKYGGWLERLSSDALLIVFNAPFDQDDHVIRGTRCAIEIQMELARFNRESRVRPLGSFNLAIGVATGPVFIGTTDDEESPRFVLVGDTIELASRLSALTPTGQVWVNQHNAETLPMYIPSVMLGAIGLRGRAQAVAPYRVWPPP